MTKKERLRRIRRRILKANYYICQRKRSYETTDDAWDKAMFDYITYGSLSVPYKCPVGRDHYHLTTNFTLNDVSSILPRARDLYLTSRHPDPDPCFFTRLRKWLGLVK